MTSRDAGLAWDIFCRVIDNHGDLGVCWRLSAELAARGHRVRLFVDDASALTWMAPDGAAGVQTLAWEAGCAPSIEPGDVVIEAFGCELDPAFQEALARRAASGRPPVWLNLEYLSAEAFVERNHGLASPVSHGPARGLVKHFFYPGFTGRTGGLLRERDLAARRAGFRREDWLQARGTGWRAGERVLSLFCYEPEPLGALLEMLAADATASRLLVTPGRPAAAVRALPQVAAHPGGWGRLALHFLPALPQPAFDELLWASDLAFVRGEDSLVRALCSGGPFVWQIYPQDDDAHHRKLEAFLAWMRAGESLADFMRRWNGLPAAASSALPALDLPAWSREARAASDRAWALPELVTCLEAFVQDRRR